MKNISCDMHDREHLDNLIGNPIFTVSSIRNPNYLSHFFYNLHHKTSISYVRWFHYILFKDHEKHLIALDIVQNSMYKSFFLLENDFWNYGCLKKCNYFIEYFLFHVTKRLSMKFEKASWVSFWESMQC